MRTAFHLVQAEEDQQKTVLTIAENLSNDETADVEDIVAGVETVSSAATELTRLQDDGYAYIRP